VLKTSSFISILFVSYPKSIPKVLNIL